MDIITLDEEVNKRLYSCAKEFVDVFEESFTATEWEQLQAIYHASGRDDELLKREFFIRWSIKEAYTKALGVGLGFDFGSFQMEYESAQDSWVDRLAVCEQHDARPIFCGTVTTRKGFVPEKEIRVTDHERWLFVFDKLETPNLWGKNCVTGYACTSIGPIPGDLSPEDISLDIDVDVMTIRQLIDWHRDSR